MLPAARSHATQDYNVYFYEKWKGAEKLHGEARFLGNRTRVPSRPFRGGPGCIRDRLSCNLFQSFIFEEKQCSVCVVILGLAFIESACIAPTAELSGRESDGAAKQKVPLFCASISVCGCDDAMHA